MSAKVYGIIGIQKKPAEGATWHSGKVWRTKEEAVKLAKTMQQAVDKGGKTKMKFKIMAVEVDGI